MWSFFVITTYILGNLFILYRIFCWFNATIHSLKKGFIKKIVAILYTIIASIPLIAFLLPKSTFQRYLQIFSNFFFGVYVYMIMIALIFFLLFLLLKYLFKKNIYESKIYLYGIAVVNVFLVILLSVYGTIHANILYVKSYDISINKVAKKENLNLVLFSDLHLGYSVSLPTIKKVVKQTNKLKPDIILIAGDIFDNDYESVHEPEKIKNELKKLKAKYGTYAVFGNHDIDEKLFAGFSMQKKEKAYRDPRMERLLTEANIKILDDEAVTIDNFFHLVGRLDYKKTGNGISKRKNLHTLTKNLDSKLPLIVLEHEPKNLEESEQEGAVLHVAGHTHNGQFFPFNLTGGFFFENFYGIYQKGKMTSIVTSGVGVYGPDIRVGTNSEIMQIKLHFKKNK